MTGRVDEALRVAETLGCRLLPCHPGRKVARLKDWPNKASAERREIERWFGGKSQANMAVVCGFESGFFVLDIDPKNGGVETLQQWIADHGPLPETLTVKTPSGGRHLYFSWPTGGGVGNRGHVDSGIDVRGEGGYVLIPGSVIDNVGAYEWTNWGTALAQAPTWLLTLIRRHHATKPAASAGPAPQVPIGWGERDREERVAKAALDSICIEINSAANGTQDTTLNGGAYRVGRWVARGHLPEDYARERLMHAGMSMVSYEASDPWTALLISRKVERAMRDGRNAGPADLAPREPPKVIEGGSTRPRGAKAPEGAPAPDLKVAASDTDWMRDLPFKRGDKGLDPRDPQNIRLMIEYWPETRGRYSYDKWADALIVNRPWPEDPRKDYPRPLTDSDLLALQAHLWRQRVKPSEGLVAAALSDVAQRVWAMNPLLDYLQGLKWDGTERATWWLTTYMGVPESPQSALFGRKFLIGAAARALWPRCKNDTMLNVQGPQGARKSTAFRTLFGENYFSDNLGDVRDKDALMGLAGMWCIEWSEMSGQGRIPDADMKAFLSRQEDYFRPPYGRHVIMRPRRCVIVGTTNRKTYLRDSTGARRYWPVVSEAPIDVEGLARDRDQLWAEVVHRVVDLKETWWLEGPEELSIAEVAQEDVYEGDTWEDIIRQKIAEDMPQGFEPTYMILNFWLGIEQSKLTVEHSRRLAAIMERIGIPRKVDRKDGKQMRGYWFGDKYGRPWRDT